MSNIAAKCDKHWQPGGAEEAGSLWHFTRPVMGGEMGGLIALDTGVSWWTDSCACSDNDGESERLVEWLMYSARSLFAEFYSVWAFCPASGSGLGNTLTHFPSHARADGEWRRCKKTNEKLINLEHAHTIVGSVLLLHYVIDAITIKTRFWSATRRRRRETRNFFSSQ